MMKQKKSEPNEMSERLVEAALEIIEERGGLHGVNLRQIASQAGCAHTNVYNYYENFEALLWVVFDRIGAKWMEYTHQNVQRGQGDTILQFFRAQFGFALEHPGWYRCLWMEPLSGKPPQEIVDSRRSQRDKISAILRGETDRPMNKEQSDWIFNILFSYVHGSISMLINGRIYRQDPESYKTETMQNVQTLINVLKDQNEPQHQ